MVKICNTAYPDNSKYESYFEWFPYPLSDFQKFAVEAIIEGHHALVTAHTGSGKTLPAEFAIGYFVGQKKKKVIYCSPIKALSNQKYYEFTRKYPDISVGLFTGDIKTNPNADVLIMTTEILMNYLFTATTNEENNGLQFQIDIANELACVVFDEVHYINDIERGQVWEKSILLLPEHVQMLMLSATIDNPEGFATWVEQRSNNDKQVYLASTNVRVVPLTHYGFFTVTEGLFKVVKDKATEKQVRELTDTLIPLSFPENQFSDAGHKNIVYLEKIVESAHQKPSRKHVLNRLSEFLRDRDMLPAIAFVFSRKNVELFAHDVTVPLLEFDSKVGYTARYECEQIIRKLPNYREYLALPEYEQLIELLEKGIGIHHSGMIPVLREIVELMISKKYIKLLFATESFAIGLDCPIRTAVFTSLTKFDGQHERLLLAHEYSQMAGRAGRRGIDTIGHVVHCNNLFSVPPINEYKRILGGVPQKLVSKFHVSYSLILNLMKQGHTDNFHLFSEKSMIQGEIANQVAGLRAELDVLNKQLDQIMTTFQNNTDSTPKEVCSTYDALVAKSKTLVNKKRKDAVSELESMLQSYPSLKEDCVVYKEWLAVDQQHKEIEYSITYLHNYLREQTEAICQVMVEEGFIEAIEGGGYKLLPMGHIATHVAEVHPLILTKQVFKNDCPAFSPKEWVGLISCFTDVNVPADQRITISSLTTNSSRLDTVVKQLVKEYEHYYDMETKRDIRTGIRYLDAMQFDLVELSMAWCDLETEEECKGFIQGEVADRGISVGDFTKAMMKIVTITKEWINVCETIGLIELKHTFSQIESMILKYVLITQSLYV